MRDKLQNHANEGKGRRKRKSEEEERKRREKWFNGCTLGFYNGYFKDLAEKKTVGREGPFGGNVFKNPARNV